MKNITDYISNSLNESKYEVTLYSNSGSGYSEDEDFESMFNDIKDAEIKTKDYGYLEPVGLSLFKKSEDVIVDIICKTGSKYVRFTNYEDWDPKSQKDLSRNVEVNVTPEEINGLKKSKIFYRN